MLMIMQEVIIREKGRLKRLILAHLLEHQLLISLQGRLWIKMLISKRKLRIGCLGLDSFTSINRLNDCIID